MRNPPETLIAAVSLETVLFSSEKNKSLSKKHRFIYFSGTMQMKYYSSTLKDGERQAKLFTGSRAVSEMTLPFAPSDPKERLASRVRK